MERKYSRYLPAVYLSGDLALVILCRVEALWLASGESGSLAFSDPFWSQTGIAAASWIISLFLAGVYKTKRVAGYIDNTSHILRILFLNLIIHQAILSFIPALNPGIRETFFYFILLFSLTFAWRISLYAFLRYYRKQGYNFRKVVIAGSGASALSLSRLFHNHPELGYKFEGFYHNPSGESIPSSRGTINELLSDATSFRFDEIYCILSELSEQDLEKITTMADRNFIRVRLLPDTKGFNSFRIDNYGNIPVLSLRQSKLDDDLSWYAKRAFDITFSLLVIILVLSWLVPLMALIIKLDSKGPVFFRQSRNGFHGRVFTCFKFRSMRPNDESETRQATINDERITATGRFLRKYNIDELPQFFNVLKGEMSIVGPRPHMIEHTENYSREITSFMVRHTIRPGITGLSQVKGYRGPTAGQKQMERRVQFDIFYIENWSFLLDLKILLMTMLNVVKGEENAL